jgi:predicted nucleic acid-binding protein
VDVIAFFDASALIYLVEGSPPFADRLRAELSRWARRHPDAGSAVSRLSWLECRVRPAREGDQATLAAFDAFFARPDLVWIELTREVVELATAIRVRHGLRTPDALQAASCLQLGSKHVFLTGDVTFRRVAGLNVRLLA